MWVLPTEDSRIIPALSDTMSAMGIALYMQNHVRENDRPFS